MTIDADDKRRTGTLIRQEMKQAWPWKNWVLAFLLVLAITGVQITVGYLITPGAGSRMPRTMYADRLAWLGLLSFFGLASPIGHYLTIGGPSAWMSAAGTLPTTLVSAAWSFLLPGYAATVIARSRKYRDTGELIAAGLSPRQVLVGKGVGRLAPFLVLAAVCWVLSLLALPMLLEAMAGAGRGTSTGASYRSGLLLTSLSMVVLTPLGWLLRAAIAVGLSALCRRVWSAISLCYVVELLLLPGAYFLLVNTLQKYWHSLADFWISPLLGGGLMLLLEAALLAVLIPSALSALRQDATEGAA